MVSATGLGKSAPGALVALRFALGPLLLLVALTGQGGGWFALGFVVGFLSDVFDGVIARRFKVSTARLRQADSWADICFYGCLGLSSVWLYWEVVSGLRIGLISFGLAWLVWATVNWFKYRRLASYHTYLAKACGLVLFVAILTLFIFGYVAWLMWAAIALGIAYNLEEILMTWLLPVWAHDVPSLWHALEIRRQAQG